MIALLFQATVPDGTDKVKIYEAFQANQIKLQAAQREIRYLETDCEVIETKPSE